MKVSDDIDPDVAAQIAETMEGFSPKGKEVFKMKDGERLIRVLPGTWGPRKNLFYVTHYQHWAPDVNSKMQYNKGFTCPKFQNGKDEAGVCPFCDMRAAVLETLMSLKEDLKDASPEHIPAIKKKIGVYDAVLKSLNYRKAYIINVIDRDDSIIKPRVWYAPKTVFEPILKAYALNGHSILSMTDGHDFRITKAKEANQTKYSADLKVKSSPVGNAETIEAVKEKMWDLDKEITTDSVDTLSEACKKLMKMVQTEALSRKEETRTSLPDIDDDDDVLPGVDVNTNSGSKPSAGGSHVNETRKLLDDDPSDTDVSVASAIGDSGRGIDLPDTSALSSDDKTADDILKELDALGNV